MSPLAWIWQGSSHLQTLIDPSSYTSSSSLAPSISHHHGGGKGAYLLYELLSRWGGEGEGMEGRFQMRGDLNPWPATLFIDGLDLEFLHGGPLSVWELHKNV